MTKKFQEDSDVLTAAFPSIFSERFGNVDTAVAQDLTEKFQAVAAKWAKRRYPSNLLAALDHGLFVHLDFFFLPGIQSASYQAHPTKRMRFHGITFDYPQDANVVMSGIQASLWNKLSPDYQVSLQNDICAFSKPDNSVSYDIPKSKESVSMAL